MTFESCPVRGHGIALFTLLFVALQSTVVRVAECFASWACDHRQSLYTSRMKDRQGYGRVCVVRGVDGVEITVSCEKHKTYRVRIYCC